MKLKLAIIFTIAGACLVSGLLYRTSLFLAEIDSHLRADFPVPEFTNFMWSPIPYLYPIPLVLWAFSVLRRKPNPADSAMLLVSISTALTLVFVSLFLLALVLPHLPHDKNAPLRPIQVQSAEEGQVPAPKGR